MLVVSEREQYFSVSDKFVFRKFGIKHDHDLTVDKLAKKAKDPAATLRGRQKRQLKRESEKRKIA